mmetsp:Transcript_33060/g.75500  ORF Transcript_33060/g.75500 Transcript_33060/m.75500 type:complete len:812 (-) Transcript_33060:177-2612(-)
MIASNAKLALSLILSVADIGTNKFALGHDDALQFDQILHGNDVSAETGLNDAGGTAPTTKFERSIRLAGVPTTTHVEVGADRGAGEHDKGFVEVGGRVLQGDCSTVPSWHPQYLGGWDGGYCAFETGCGSPGYSSELACCKSAYAGQMSGFCLSKLEAPPTTSPTTSDFTVDFWYPDYDTAWTSAGCLNTLPLPYNNIKDRPNYSSQLECCKAAYAGQMSGACLSKLGSPPTTSPTNMGNTGSQYYPDYGTAWYDAGCINKLPVPSGRPTYTSHLACCKGAYGGQMSGACLSQLESPPSTSPTSAGGLDVYYPDYGTAWDKAACVNTRPMPSGRPVYSTMLACCKGAYAGQMSGYCLSQLEAPPTTSPTSSDSTVDFWYPDYDSAWSDAGCLNSLPLPYLPGGRPTYTTNEACCSAAYGGQVSRACICSTASPPANCWDRLMSSPATKTAESTLTLDGVNSLPSTDSGMQALTSRIKAIIQGGLSDGAQVLSISNVSFENGEVSFNVEIGYDSSKTSEDSIDATVAGAAESSPTASPTSGPTGTPTQSPSNNPTLSPTAGPTPSPTRSPVLPGQFTTNAELRTAIQEYLSQGCRSNSNCQARTDYNGAIGDWDVSRVQDFKELFQTVTGGQPITGAHSFNEPINWDTGSATSFSRMFTHTRAFNQAISFDTSRVTDMNHMFAYNYVFNSPISFTDTSKVTSMGWMFHAMYSFNRPVDFLNDTSKVKDMSGMFADAFLFNQPIQSYGWDVSSVENIAYMFQRGGYTFNQNLCGFFDFATLTGKYRPFYQSGCSNQGDPTSASGPWCAVSSCP